MCESVGYRKWKFDLVTDQSFWLIWFTQDMLFTLHFNNLLEGPFIIFNRFRNVSRLIHSHADDVWLLSLSNQLILNRTNKYEKNVFVSRGLLIPLMTKMKRFLKHSCDMWYTYDVIYMHIVRCENIQFSTKPKKTTKYYKPLEIFLFYSVNTGLILNLINTLKSSKLNSFQPW